MPLRRPRLVRFLVTTAVLGAVYVGCGRSPRGAREPEGPFQSCQLHVHGPFSEGLGSVDSQTWEAARFGLDCLWWSEHDFRAAGYHAVQHYGFEALEEPQATGEDWRPFLARREADTKGCRPWRQDPGTGGELVEEPVFEGRRALSLHARGGGEAFRTCVWTFETRRLLFRRALAHGLVLRLAVLPARLGPDEGAFVRVDLSEHAPRGDLGLVPLALVYELVAAPADPRREGPVYRVPVVCEPGRWNELVLDLTRDAGQGFPFLPGPPGEDNALFGLSFGVRARRTGTAECAFDALTLQAQRSGSAALRRQRELLAAVEPAYPVRQLQGLEVSYAARHLNEFSLEPALLDYDAIARECGWDPGAPASLDPVRFRELVMRRAVEGAHRRGGLISWNHMFGVNPPGSPRGKTPEQMLELLLAERDLGIDLLEVGYRDRAGASLQDHLWVWDQAALRGLRMVGIGTSDSHGGPADRWESSPNNFVSWIQAERPEKPELLAGLRAGRVFFGDLTRFDGQLDLVTDAGHRMGREVLTDRPSVEVAFLGRDLPPGALVRWIRGGEVGGEFPVDGPRLDAVRRVELPPSGPTLVRFEIRDAGGEPLALTNPIHFLRAVPPGGLDPIRGAFDLEGLRSAELEGVRLVGLRRPADGVLELELESRGGHLVLDGVRGRTASLVGDAVLELSPERWVLRAIQGRVRLTVRSP